MTTEIIKLQLVLRKTAKVFRKKQVQIVNTNTLVYFSIFEL
jgi:hypothetical protein